MFWLILLSIASVMNVYVIWRATSVPALTERVSGRYIWLLGILLLGLLILGRLYGHSNQGDLAAWLERLGMIWLAALFLLFNCLLALDVVTLFGLLAPKRAPMLRGVALVIGLLLTGFGLYQGLRSPVVERYVVELPNLPQELDGTTIAVMSDLHLGAQRGKRWLRARIEQVNSLKPDIAVLVGDVFEGHGAPVRDLFPIMLQLKAPIGSFAVLGNHEFHGGGVQGQRALEASGLKVLRNKWVEVRPGLIIAGVDDLTTRRRRDMEHDDYISKALTGRPAGATILLSHTPWDTDLAAAKGVGLMLSGHTHQGQIWPFGHLVSLSYPLLGGRYKAGEMTVIVCRGTGLWGPPVRLWRPSEIVHVLLKAKR